MKNKNLFKSVVIFLMFVISLINNVTLLCFMLGLIFIYKKEKSVGAIKALCLITIRSFINVSIGITFNSVAQIVKYLFLGFICIYIIVKNIKYIQKSKAEYNIIIFFIIFIISISVFSLVTSSYPTISVFKAVFFGISFLSAFVGIRSSYEKVDWLNWLNKVFICIALISIPLYFTKGGYLRNGHAFQGITNQPNLFAVILTIGLMFFVVYKEHQNERYNFLDIIYLTIIYIELYTTESRTALLSSLLCIIYLLSFRKIFKNYKTILCSFSFISLVVIFIVIKFDFIYKFIAAYIMKGNTNLLYSRENLYSQLIANYHMHPLIGCGFLTPVVSGIKDWTFSIDLPVEPGNIFIALLSYTGVIGLTMFLLFVIVIFLLGGAKKENWPLLIVPLCLNMGEMAFFSPNNYAIFYYISIALYYF